MENQPSNRRQPRAVAQARKAAWPQGATAGVLIIAAACLALSIALYHVAGPRDVFAEETSR